MRKIPNILLIMADQLAAKYTGSYGHALVKTPHMDALAENGVLFNEAYCNCPICAPSRASFCAGKLVSNIGVYDNGAELPASTPTLMHQLKRAGYRTWLSGKMHFIGPDQHHGFDRRLTTDIYPSGFNWTPDWRQSPCANPGSAVDQLKDSGLCKWSLQLDYDEETHFRAMGALQDLSRIQDDNTPFFLAASYTHPHDPFYITQEWWDLYEHQTIDMPKPGSCNIGDMHPYDQWLQTHHMVDEYPPTETHILNSRHAYYGMVSYFDSKVGELVHELKRLGLAENTIIIVTSDHGEMLGEHGMWFKRTCYDASVRVPLIISGTDVVKGGRTLTNTVSLVDLFPTLMDWAGLENAAEVAETLDGHSMKGIIADDDEEWDRPAISEYYSEGVCQPVRMAVKDRLKYIYVHKEEPQLYDLTMDPDETNNCINEPNYQPSLEVLKKAVHENWDPELQTTRVLESQRNRRLINDAVNPATHGRWDVRPDFDPSKQYVRQDNCPITSKNRRYPKTGK